MNIEEILDLLLWCTVINLGFLLWWLLFFLFAHDWVYQMHNRWFKLSRETFDTIHYSGMGLFKIAILLFNLVPYLALCIVV